MLVAAAVALKLETAPGLTAGEVTVTVPLTLAPVTAAPAAFE